MKANLKCLQQKSYRGKFIKISIFDKKNQIFAQNGRLEVENISITYFNAYHIEEHIVCYTNIFFLKLFDHICGNKWTFTYCPFLRTLDTNGLNERCFTKFQI